LDNVKETLERLKPLVRGLPGILIPNAVDVGIIRKNAPHFETSAEHFENEYPGECLADQS
jgi:hypothetical protein